MWGQISAQYHVIRKGWLYSILKLLLDKCRKAAQGRIKPVLLCAYSPCEEAPEEQESVRQRLAKGYSRTAKKRFARP